MRPLALLLSVTALAAAAQTTTVQPLEIRAADGTDTLAISASQCSGSVTARWSYTTALGNLCTPMKVWATLGECSESGPGASDTRFDDVPLLTVATMRADNLTIKVSELPGFKSGSSTPCGADGITVTHRVCAVIEYSTYQCGLSTQLKLSASPLKIVYDRQPPSAPDIVEALAQDGAATLKFTADSDTYKVSAEYQAPSSAVWVAGGEVGVSATQIRVGGLTNGNSYGLRLRAIDQAGNISEPSEQVAVTPIRTVGFWGVYREKGGSDPGGCSAVPLGPALAAALAWTSWRRRSKR